MTEETKTAAGDAAMPIAAPAEPAKRRRRKGRARGRSKAPEKVLRLTTYERLEEYLQAFARGHFQDRGHVLLFQPGAAEVHAQAGTWFDDREIYEWFAANLHRVHEPSLRHYVRARELKTA